MIKLIILVIIITLFYYCFSQHLHINFKTFFKKGFKKFDNDFGLYCFTGKQGKGKTYSATKFCLDQQKIYDYTILTNIKSFAETSSNILYISDINTIIDYCVKYENNEEKVIIFFDEIFTILNKNTPINKKILSFLSQLRKRHIIFITTAQEWSEINITFRRYVRFQIACNMISLPLIKTAIVINAVNDGDLIKWDNDSQDFVAPRLQTNISKGLKSVIDRYDTFETINTN